jgi:hypothetical protein
VILALVASWTPFSLIVEDKYQTIPLQASTDIVHLMRLAKNYIKLEDCPNINQF